MDKEYLIGILEGLKAEIDLFKPTLDNVKQLTHDQSNVIVKANNLRHFFRHIRNEGE